MFPRIDTFYFQLLHLHKRYMFKKFPVANNKVIWTRIHQRFKKIVSLSPWEHNRFVRTFQRTIFPACILFGQHNLGMMSLRGILQASISTICLILPFIIYASFRWPALFGGIQSCVKIYLVEWTCDWMYGTHERRYIALVDELCQFGW